jgi:hypothetical protein
MWPVMEIGPPWGIVVVSCIVPRVVERLDDFSVASDVFLDGELGLFNPREVDDWHVDDQINV